MITRYCWWFRNPKANNHLLDVKKTCESWDFNYQPQVVRKISNIKIPPSTTTGAPGLSAAPLEVGQTERSRLQAAEVCVSWLVGLVAGWLVGWVGKFWNAVGWYWLGMLVGWYWLLILGMLIIFASGRYVFRKGSEVEFNSWTIQNLSWMEFEKLRQWTFLKKGGITTTHLHIGPIFDCLNVLLSEVSEWHISQLQDSKVAHKVMDYLPPKKSSKKRCILAFSFLV